MIGRRSNLEVNPSTSLWHLLHCHGQRYFIARYDLVVNADFASLSPGSLFNNLVYLTPNFEVCKIGGCRQDF